MNKIHDEPNKELGSSSADIDIPVAIRNNEHKALDTTQSEVNNGTQKSEDEELILEEMKRIGKACQSKNLKPSISTIRSNLEQIAKKLQSNLDS